MRAFRDVRVPADPQDYETTQSQIAFPPAEFSVTVGASSNIFTITDRQFPAQRAPTVSYRIYFLPAAYVPGDVLTSAQRIAGQRLALLVADVKAPGRGTVLLVEDTKYFGQAGVYFCVGVNRRDMECPPENFVRVT